MTQKNFSIGLDFKEDFEQFCTANAYTESAVMAAAFLAFSKLKHEDRVKLFAESAAKWKPPSAKRLGAIGPTRQSGRAKDVG